MAALSLPSAYAEEGNPYIQVGQARTKKTIIAFPEIRASGSNAEAVAKQIHEIITNDLTFMDLFSFLGSSAFIESASSAGITMGSFKMTDWSSIQAEILVKSMLKVEGGRVSLEGYVYDVNGSKQLLGKRFVAGANDPRTLAHTFANNIVNALTGLPGIFLTKITMACEKSRRQEIYIMDFDGTNMKQITRHNSISLGPAWSPDGTRIVYSRYVKHRSNVKNLDLYEFDFSTETVRMLSNRKGINSGANYSPDGRKIALTMSFLGNPEIFTLDSKTGVVTRVTKSFGEDVDPAWSPDGSKIAFVSSRSGRPMVYSMNSDGSNVKRLTFAGVYNATPNWSQTNNKMVFAGWLDRRFDIFLMNPDGTNIERLTKDQGNNEDPSFSPDGNFVVFSSNRTGGKNIYVMNVDGTFVKRLTYGVGNCMSPKWSNPPRPATEAPLQAGGPSS
ncbi:MAG TPA: Tol-Pal system beta propeller repeat protein TolB [Bdellovibrionota bacterium]|nr:Tol-Pal system beta propeller repeat protein TolB [Bdellovibrionota bacterium]